MKALTSTKKFITLGVLIAGLAAAVACAGPGAAGTTTAPAATSAPSNAATLPAGQAAQSAAPTQPAGQAAQPLAATQGVRTYQIQPDSSQARYVINEVLRGAPFTVNGSTNQVTGEITVDPTDPSTAQIGTIRIDANSFATEDSRRDQTLQQRILETSTYPEITFTPHGIQNLPEMGAVGETYTFPITGDLTVHGVTRPETFDATLTVVSPDRLEGTAKTTIRYADYGINIPQVPIVSGVAETVALSLDFVATAG